MLYQSARLRLECSEGAATLWLDATTLTRALLHEMDRALATMRRCRSADVLVIRSGRPGVFLSGPDLHEYGTLTDAPSRRSFAQSGQATLARLQGLSPEIATIALVEGECSNAGLELALACDFRLAVARPETRLGFDALERGLLPCWGAATRLVQLLGPRRALELLVRGTVVPARGARQLGLVDHAFSARAAKTELWWFIAEVQDRRRRPGPRSGWSWRRLLPLWADATVFWPSLAQLGADEPARALVEAARRGWRDGPAAGLAAERAAFAEHGLHPQAAWRRSLALERQDWARSWCAIAAPRRVGLTALDETSIPLAVAALAAGGSLALQVDEQSANVAHDTLRRALLRAVDQGWFNILEAQQRLGQTRLASGPGALGDADIVFLTGPDAAQAERAIELDQSLPADRPLVHTSTAINVERLVRPERVIGISVTPSPVARAAVELMPTAWTDEPTIARLFRWLEACGQWPIVRAADGSVHSRPAAA